MLRCAIHAPGVRQLNLGSLRESQRRRRQIEIGTSPFGRGATL